MCAADGDTLETMLLPGNAAPDFTLPDEHGHPLRLADLRGHWVLLWWYPKAQTPGCTVQGQGLRDHADEFDAHDTVIVGMSFDTPEENLAFVEAQGFPFHLVSDTDRDVGRAFGVVRPATDRYADYSRRYSFLVDPDGTIRRTYDVADVDGHAEAVLADLDELQSGPQ